MLNPLMLLGLLGLAGPIILHLIQRQRMPLRPLATLKFLPREDVVNTFAWVPRDILQLLLRLLLLLMLVLLMSRCAIVRDDPAPRTMTVILDQSLSMQRSLAGGKTLFDEQKERVLDLIAGLREGDRVSLMLVGDAVTAETGFLRDREELRKIASGFGVTEGGDRALAPAIERAISRLRDQRTASNCVLVFSDFLRQSYAERLGPPPPREAKQGSDGPQAPKVSLEKAGPSPFPKLLEKGTVQLFLVGPTLKAEPNVAVETGRFVPARTYLGATARLTATVRNWSGEEQTANISLQDAGKQVDTKTLRLWPGEAAQVDLQQRIEFPSDKPYSVHTEGDALLADNDCHLPMRVRARRVVLMVAPPPEASKDVNRQETSCSGPQLLASAFNPGETLGTGSDTFVTVKQIAPHLLERESLPRYSFVVLYGVAGLSETSRKDLAAYLDNGGGLYMVPDLTMSPLRLNEFLEPLLGGLRVGAPRRPEEALRLDRNEGGIGTPLLRPLLREEWGDLDDIHVLSHWSLQQHGSAACALGADNGDWLAATACVGRGRVFLQLFDCDLKETSFPRTPIFPAMVQQISAWLGGDDGGEEADAVRVGEEAWVRMPEVRRLGGAVQVKGPTMIQAPVNADGDVRVAGLLRAGGYSLSHPARTGAPPRWLGVNPALGESDLTPMTEAEQSRIFGPASVERLAYGDLAGRFNRRHEIFPLLLALLLAAFALEAVAGAWQSLRRKGDDAE